MKSRIEINDSGEFFIVIPEDVASEYRMDEGDILEWDINDPELIIISLV
jgi:bifunctional DNA-binding transcriptional regulator/antitoxin component of YhaV-PrlF toxin-antitoxin module